MPHIAARAILHTIEQQANGGIVTEYLALASRGLWRDIVVRAFPDVPQAICDATVRELELESDPIIMGVREASREGVIIASEMVDQIICALRTDEKTATHAATALVGRMLPDAHVDVIDEVVREFAPILRTIRRQQQNTRPTVEKVATQRITAVANLVKTLHDAGVSGDRALEYVYAVYATIERELDDDVPASTAVFAARFGATIF